MLEFTEFEAHTNVYVCKDRIEMSPSKIKIEMRSSVEGTEYSMWNLCAARMLTLSWQKLV